MAATAQLVVTRRGIRQQQSNVKWPARSSGGQRRETRWVVTLSAARFYSLLRYSGGGLGWGFAPLRNDSAADTLVGNPHPTLSRRTGRGEGGGSARQLPSPEVSRTQTRCRRMRVHHCGTFRPGFNKVTLSLSLGISFPALIRSSGSKASFTCRNWSMVDLSKR